MFLYKAGHGVSGWKGEGVWVPTIPSDETVYDHAGQQRLVKVLIAVDARRQSLRRIVLADADLDIKEDRPAIVSVGDKMH